jgi:hypothetical protein
MQLHNVGVPIIHYAAMIIARILVIVSRNVKAHSCIDHATAMMVLGSNVETLDVVSMVRDREVLGYIFLTKFYVAITSSQRQDSTANNDSYSYYECYITKLV